MSPGAHGIWFGGIGHPTGAPPLSISKYHDIIRFSPNTAENLFRICAPLYEQGLSLREIERQTGFARSSIREALTERGLVLRPTKRCQKRKWKKPTAMRSGVIPYGYAYLEGRLVVDPREYKTVLQAVRWWKSGKSYTAIAKLLNDKKVPTRLGKRWTHSVVKRVIERHLESEK